MKVHLELRVNCSIFLPTGTAESWKEIIDMLLLNEMKNEMSVWERVIAHRERHSGDDTWAGFHSNVVGIVQAFEHIVYRREVSAKNRRFLMKHAIGYIWMNVVVMNQWVHTWFKQFNRSSTSLKALVWEIHLSKLEVTFPRWSTTVTMALHTYSLVFSTTLQLKTGIILARGMSKEGLSSSKILLNV